MFMRQIGLALTAISCLVGQQVSTSSHRHSRADGSTSSPAPATDMPMNTSLVAPFFEASTNTSSVLTLVHDVSKTVVASIGIFDTVGRTIATFQESIPPHGQVAIQLNDELEKRQIVTPVIGSLSVNVTGTIQLGAQLSFSRMQGSTVDSFEEELVMLSPSAKNVFRAVAAEASTRPIIALKSLIDVDQTVTLSCLEEGQPADQQTLTLPSQHMLLARACQRTSGASDTQGGSAGNNQVGDPKTIGVSIESSAPPESLAAFGIVSRSGSISESMPFTQVDSLRSTDAVYAGAPVGPTKAFELRRFTPKLSATNFLNTPVHMRILFSSPNGTSNSSKPVQDVLVAPYSSVSVLLDSVAGDRDMRSTYVVSSDGEKGQIIATLASESSNGSYVDVPRMDRLKSTNGGQHPWIVDSRTDSYLVLFNAHESPQSVDAHVYGDQQATKLVTIAPHETLVLSLAVPSSWSSATSEPASLASQSSVSQAKQTGIVTWSTLAGDFIFGRVIQVDKISQSSRNFSCELLNVACAAIISPQSVTMAVNEQTTLTGYALTCPSSSSTCDCDYGSSCGPGYQTGSVYGWGVDNQSIASVSYNLYQSTATVTANSAGQANISMQVNDNTYLGCYGDTSGPGGQMSTVAVVPSPCWAQLKYRPVYFNDYYAGNHAFWWIQRSNGEHRVMDAGPDGPTCPVDCGYLVDWVSAPGPPDVGHYSEDNGDASQAWTTPSAGWVCQQVEMLFNWSQNWNQTQYYYQLTGPNSNSWAHIGAYAVGFSPTPPPDAPGWDSY